MLIMNKIDLSSTVYQSLTRLARNRGFRIEQAPAGLYIDIQDHDQSISYGGQD